LKPSNIMLTKSGAKLMDFGLVKSVAATFHGVTHPAPIPSQDLPTIGATTPTSPEAPFTERCAIVGTLLYKGSGITLRSTSRFPK
jgi:eukaryotic-like serine/threonine-protein kinase